MWIEAAPDDIWVLNMECIPRGNDETMDFVDTLLLDKSKGFFKRMKVRLSEDEDEPD
jgi:hypothetical protein